MAELSTYKQQLDSNNSESENLKRKIQNLHKQNAGLAEEVRNAQENLRLSNAQNSKAFNELQEYQSRLEQIDGENMGIKKKMQNLVSENQALGD